MSAPQIRTSSMPTEKRIRPSPMPTLRRTSARHRGVGHRRRMANEAFHAAEALRQREKLQPPAKRQRRFRRAIQLRDDNARTALHLAAGQLVLRMARQERDSAPAHAFARLQPARPARARWRNAAPSATRACAGRAWSATRRTATAASPALFARRSFACATSRRSWPRCRRGNRCGH